VLSQGDISRTKPASVCQAPSPHACSAVSYKHAEYLEYIHIKQPTLVIRDCSWPAMCHPLSSSADAVLGKPAARTRLTHRLIHDATNDNRTQSERISKAI
jgi:hypothetical protein